MADLHEVYVYVRDGDVHRSECIGTAVTLDRDETGALLGVEVLGAAWVEVDGQTVGGAQ